MDYICYISRSKVDQFHSQLQPKLVTDQTERHINERSRSTEVHAGLSAVKVIDLFQGGLSFGRRDVLQRDQKIRVAYVDKLRDVLLAIAADQGDIPDIAEAINTDRFDNIYYYHSGRFRAGPVKDPSNPAEIVTIYSRSASHQIILDCSLRFFSGSLDEDPKYLITSGNRQFFTGRISLRLSGVFVLLDSDAYRIVGTPIYLQLSGSESAHESL